MLQWKPKAIGLVSIVVLVAAVLVIAPALGLLYTLHQRSVFDEEPPSATVGASD